MVNVVVLVSSLLKYFISWMEISVPDAIEYTLQNLKCAFVLKVVTPNVNIFRRPTRLLWIQDDINM